MCVCVCVRLTFSRQSWEGVIADTRHPSTTPLWCVCCVRAKDTNHVLRSSGLAFVRLLVVVGGEQRFEQPASGGHQNDAHHVDGQPPVDVVECAIAFAQSAAFRWLVAGRSVPEQCGQQLAHQLEQLSTQPEAPDVHLVHTSGKGVEPFEHCRTHLLANVCCNVLLLLLIACIIVP